MGPRNMLILFFSTLCVSLVLLIILFSFGFKDVDLEFNTKLPESAPSLGDIYKEEGEPKDSRVEGVTTATIRVPQSGRPLDSINGISPTEDVAPELQEEQKSEETQAPTPDNPDGKKDAKKDEKSKKDKKDANDDSGVKTAEEAPVPELKPLIPQKEKPKTVEAKKPEPKEEAPEPKKVEKPGTAYQVYKDGFSTREAAEAAAAQMGGAGTQPFVRSAGSGYIVQVGVFGSKENADSVAGKTGAKVRKL